MADEPRWISVARADELAPGSVKACWIENYAVALVNLDGELCAVQGTCPHREGPLGEGRVVDQTVACPWHGFRFDPRSGQAAVPPDYPPLATYAVRVAEGDIQVAWPPNA